MVFEVSAALSEVSEMVFEVSETPSEALAALPEASAAPFRVLETPGKLRKGAAPTAAKADKTKTTTNRLPIAISRMYRHLVHFAKHLFAFYYLYKTKAAKYPAAHPTRSLARPPSASARPPQGSRALGGRGRHLPISEA